MDTLGSSRINFYQGTTNLIKEEGAKKQPLEYIKERVAEFFNMKNVHFLFGSGTSCNAIPNMEGLYDAVRKKIYSQSDKKLKVELYSIIRKLQMKTNLEEILGILYSHKNYLDGKSENKEMLSVCCNLINEIETVIFEKLNVDFSEPSCEVLRVLGIYQSFYRKIALRNKDLSRINIFTTNNDLFNEAALDSLSIHYINGFSGGLDRFFNPALFNYTFAKRMDTSIEKFEPVENMIYLYKLHGSINWIEDVKNKNKFFKTKEIYKPSKENNNILIFPTPIKQNKSLGSPYVELFREFQKKLLDPHSVLFIIGYSFSDEHVNNIIYQALAVNSTINVVIINDVNDKDISKNNDNRIFKIWGEVEKENVDGAVDTKDKTEKIHFFNYIVQNLLPNIDAFKQKDTNIEKFITFYNESLSK